MAICNTLFQFLFCITIVYCSGIPIIDISKADSETAQLLFGAAHEFGFFLIRNHGIPYNITKNALDKSKEFFALPQTEKSQLAMNESHWGYVAYQSEKTDPLYQTEGDTKESFYIQNYHDENMEKYVSYRKNQRLLTTFREYLDASHAVSIQLAKIIAISFGLSADYFEKEGIRDKSMELMHLLHYVKQKSDLEKGILGIGEHTDYQLFTILLIDDHSYNSGLQIEHNGRWMNIDVNAVSRDLDNHNEHVLVVNVADTLQKWTNDIFKSAKHRVFLDGNYDRYSIPYFVGVNPDLIIDCLPNTVTSKNSKFSKCNHEPFKAGDYLHYKINEISAATGHNHLDL